MSNFRAVILDYPKLMIENSEVKDVFIDMIQAKQINFAQTSPTYIPMSGLDMVSTHFLVYEVTNIFNPKLILALRTCYEDRVYRHNLTLPIDQYSQWMSEKYQTVFQKYRDKRGPLVDVNAWFVDPDYSFKKTGLNLSEFGFYMVVSHLLKRGYDHFVGTSNEKYKASRWVEPLGQFEKGMYYNHKFVPDPHMLILIEQFNMEWLMKCSDEFHSLYANRMEYSPGAQQGEKLYLSDQELMNFIIDRKASVESGNLIKIDVNGRKQVAS